VARISTADVMERGAAVVAVAVVGVACLLLAGIHAPVHAGLFVVAVVAAVVDIGARLVRGRRLHLPLLALPLVVGVALTVVSLVPLPHAVRALLSPEGTDRLDRLLPLLDVDAAALVRPVLAFDPPESALALVRLLWALLVVVVVADRARHRDGRALVWRTVLVVAFVVGFATVFAFAVGGARVADVIGLPVNDNHRARVLGALGLLCLGRAFTLRPRVEAAWFAVAGTLCTLLVMMTGSRGGFLALAFGVIALAVVVQRGTEAGRSLRGALLAAGGAVVALVAGAVVMAGETRLVGMAEETLENPQRIKTFLWEPSLRVAVEEPIVGVGNNGFGVAFPAVLGPGELDATLTYTHAENIVLQTLADHGLVGGGLVLLSVLVVAVIALRTLRKPAERATLPALVFLLVGDAVDFALETPAGLGLAAVAVGITAGRLAGASSAKASWSPRGSALALVVVVVVGCFAAVVAVRDWRPTIDDALATTPIAGRPAALQRALARHPSDATYATLLAIEARRRRQPAEALRWSNRALVVWPAFREAHLEAARALAVAGRLEQAMGEYREAARVLLDRALLDEIAKRSPDLATRRLALPEPLAAARLALLCEGLRREKRIAEARGCFAEVVALPDAGPREFRSAITLALEAQETTTATAVLARLVPSDRRPDGEDARLAARVVAGAEGEARALAVSTTWLPTAREPAPLLQWRLAAQQKAGLLDDAVATLEALLPLARGLRERQNVELQLVEVWLRQGAYARALTQLERTVARAPRDPALLAQKALVEVELGRIDDARATLDRLRLVAPGDRRVGAVEQRLQREQAR
jgi:O-antigen ligase/tetratricopeptide (TPR) repeat protein